MIWTFNTKWFSVIIVVISISIWSCDQKSIFRKSVNSNYLDSLLIDAVEASQERDFDIALEKLQFTLAEAEALNDYKNQVLGYNNLGNLYLFYNADKEALNYFFKALDLAELHQIDELLNTIYNNIGIIYSTNLDFEKAEEYFTKALQISQQRKENYRVGINLINLSNIKERQKKYDAASVFLAQAMDIFEEEKDTINLAVVHNNIGNVFYQQKNIREAKIAYRTALDLLELKPNSHYLPMFQFNYGKTLFEFAEYDEALDYFNRSLDASLEVKNTGKIIEVYNWIAKTKEKKGDLEQAIVFYNQSLVWKDTLLNEKSKAWVSEMQMNYEFGKKEKEIEYLQQKSKQQKLIWGGTITAVLVISVLLFYFLRVKNKNLQQQNIILEKEQALSNLEISKNQLEQQQLKQKLESKNRELATKALHLVNKNEILNAVNNQLNQINVKDDLKNADLVKRAKRAIASNINLDEQWEDFKMQFEEVHSDFFNRLTKDYPSLSQTDLRLSAYFLINLDTKEIAQISNITPESVRKRKQRLREKLNLTAEQNIREILSKYEVA